MKYGRLGNQKEIFPNESVRITYGQKITMNIRNGDKEDPFDRKGRCFKRNPSGA